MQTMHLQHMLRRKLRFFDRNGPVMVNLALPKLGRLVLLKDNFTLMLITDITMVTGDLVSLTVIVAVLKRSVKRYWPRLYVSAGNSYRIFRIFCSVIRGKAVK